MTTPDWLTAEQLAGLPGMPTSRRRVQSRAEREGWRSRSEPVRGGQRLSYALDSLPPATRAALATQGASAAATAPGMPGLLQAAKAAHEVATARQADSRTAGTAMVAAVHGPRAEERDDKLRVLVALRRFWDTYGGELCPAVEAFCQAWNAGAIDAPASVRDRWPRFTRWRTVLEWHNALQNHGGAGLVRAAPANAGQYEVLRGELGQMVLAFLHDMPHLGATQIRRQIERSGRFASLPTERAFRRGLAHWKAHNRQLLSAVTNPDQWRSHYQSAAGSRSEAVLAPNDLWEQDGTRGELELADGRRWTITGTIDVRSRRLIFKLSASPRAAVVMALTREAIAAWGVPRAIKTDNGSDYVAGQYDLALTQLGIAHPLCDPFQPQQKPHIERAIGTLLHDLYELLPGYLGHNVMERRDIEVRKSFAERLMKRGGDAEVVKLRLSPEQLQAIIDNWLADYHARPHGGLNGRSPNEVLADWAGTVHLVDERALDVFLAPASKNGLRTVTKKGIKLDHGWFNCAELGGLEGHEVQVKQLEADLGTCYVFDLAGRYIGTALDHARLGVSAAEVAAERRERQKQLLAAQKAEMKANARAVKPQELVLSILQRKAEEAVDAAENVTRLRPTRTHTSDAIDSLQPVPEAAAGPRISAAAAATLQRLEAAEQAAHAAPVAEVRDFTRPDSRYSHCVRLQARMAAGEAIAPRDLQWLEGYLRTAEHTALQRLHQGSDPLAAEAGG